MEQNRCMGCMKPKQSCPICEHCGHDERAQNQIHQLPVGTILHNQYRVGKVLGQGGFGITYIGWDLNLEVPVAIKEYYPNGLVSRDCGLSTAVSGFEGPGQKSFDLGRARFLREAKALARFADVPEIVHVRAFFEANNTAYIIMEYAQGIDLRQHVRARGGILTPQETFFILRPLMSALHLVHESGIIHRDISPDNIMMLSGGEVKLLDFGAALGVVNPDTDKPISHSTEAILKQGFAPIEQYQTRGSLGPWTDVYALCATMYYCMTGKVPPDAPARLIENEHPQWDCIPGLDKSRAAALEKGMAIYAKDRTSSVRDLYENLFAAPSAQDSPRELGKPQMPSPVELPDKGKHRKTGRKRLIILLTIFAAAALIWAAMTMVPELTLRTESPAASVEVTTEPTIPDTRWEENILMKSSGNTAFRSGVLKSQVQSVTFLDTMTDAPDSHWDVSESQDGSVIAWVIGNGRMYDLYIAAEGGVNASGVCARMFHGFTALETVNFSAAFHTEEAGSMSYMFSGCENLTQLDLTSVKTENVTDMSGMFSGCEKLESLDLSGFDTAKVTDMSYMFRGCESLKSADLSSFDTRRVWDMTEMFYGCKAMPELSLPSFDVRNVAKYERFADIGVLVNGEGWIMMFRK